MKSAWIAAVACVLAAAGASAQDSSDNGAVLASKGQQLVAANGSRLGAVYRVGQDGSVQMIIDGKMVTVPAATLSSADGKLTTSLTKSEVIGLH
jgi:hypothetical protein